MFRKYFILFTMVLSVFTIAGCTEKDNFGLTDIFSNNELSLNVKNNSYSFAMNAVNHSNLYENNVVFDKTQLKISVAVNSWARGSAQIRIFSENDIIYSRNVSAIAALNENITGLPKKIEVLMDNFSGQIAVSVRGE